MKDELLPVVIHTSIFTKIFEYYQNSPSRSNRYMDSLALYTHLYFLARKQPNIRIWASLSYLSKGTSWTPKKIINVKSDLEHIGLIKIHKSRNKNGSFGKQYIEVKFVWKPETLQKLFYQEQNETTEYKIAKALLIENFGEGYRFETDDFYDFDMEMNGADVMLSSNEFYFDDNKLICNALINGGDGIEYLIVPTERVKEIIREIAGRYTYPPEAIYRALVYKLDE